MEPSFLNADCLSWPSPELRLQHNLSRWQLTAKQQQEAATAPIKWGEAPPPHDKVDD